MFILALSEIAREVDYAFKVIGGICIVLLIGIVLAMLLFIFKFHRSSTARTKQIHGNFTLEITWIVLPTLLVIYMFFVGFKGFKMMRSVPDDHMVVEVTGQQWFWSFYYPEEDIHSDKLVLPGGKAVKFLLYSPITDVVHSFYLPDFRIKEDCVPGRENYMWIRPDMPEPGEKPTYNIFCAEYCGKDHSRMITELTVLTPEEYDQWVTEKIADKNKPVAMDVAMNPESDEIQKRGAEALYKTYCVSCHGASGRGEAESAVPKARNFTSLENWKQGTRKTEIFRSVTNGLPGTQMASFTHLSAMDRFALMHYVSSFYPGSDRPADSEEDIEQLKVDFALDKPPAPKKTLTIEEAMTALIRSGNTDLSQADSHYGEKLFSANCAICHQADGSGKVGLAPSIRNRDFLAIASDEFIRQTVLHGRRGTSMVAQRHLTQSNVTDIIAYLRSMEIANPVEITVDPAKTFHGDAQAGERKYAQFCASCHGANGEGYSAGGSGPGIGLPSFLDAVSDDYIFQTVKHGRIGTAMMPFMGAKGLANLSESDVHDIIAHLRDLRETSPVLAKLETWVELGNANTGKKVYHTHCVACHQPNGVGKAGLAPSIRNRDFLAIASDDFIKATVRQGRTGTAMIPRSDLNESQINHIIAYLRSLEIANPVKIEVDDHRKISGNVENGKMVFQQYCASCHGPNGEGYINGGSGPGIGLPGFLSVASDDYIFQTIKHGRIGTAMMPFVGAKGLANLSESDVEDVVSFLRSL